jgi:hypothetical protein
MAFAESPPQPEDSGYGPRGRNMLGFCSEMLQEAQKVVRSCQGYSNIVPTMQAIAGANTSSVLVPTDRSQTFVNEIGRNHETLHAHMTDTKPSVEFRTKNSAYQGHAKDFGGMWNVWYLNRAIDHKFGSVVDYASVAGSGYAHQQWNKAINDLDVVAFDGRDFLPVNPFDDTVQSCWGGFLRRFVPLPWAQSMFPHMAAQLEADATYEPATGLPEFDRNKVLSKADRGAPFFSSMANTEAEERRSQGIRGVHLYWFYFNDPTVNDSSDVMYVGDWEKSDSGSGYEALTNYSYRVKPNLPVYPRKRLVVHSKTALCYDGPNHYWHGMFPVSKYTMIPLPWSWLGMSPLWDCLPLQESLTFALRVHDDHVRKLTRPPVHGGRNTADDDLRKLSEMIALPGAFWKNMMPDEIGIEVIPPLDAAVPWQIDYCTRKIAERMGVDAVGALMEKLQVPAADTSDQLMFEGGASMRLRSRHLERFYREQGRMFAFNSSQFFSVGKKFRMIGGESLKPQDYMDDTTSIVPRSDDDDRDPVEIGTEWADQFDFYVAQSSLLRSAALAEVATAMAAIRLGAIDRRTFLEKLDYQNVEEIMTRVRAEMQEKVEMAAAVKGAGDQVGGIRPLGGDPRGRDATGTGAPSLGGDGYVRNQ